MDLIAEIDDYLQKTGMAPTTFGVRVLNDGKFVGRLRADPLGVTVRTIEKVRTWMCENPPVPKADPSEGAAA